MLNFQLVILSLFGLNLLTCASARKSEDDEETGLLALEKRGFLGTMIAKAASLIWGGIKAIGPKIWEYIKPTLKQMGSKMMEKAKPYLKKFIKEVMSEVTPSVIKDNMPEIPDSLNPLTLLDSGDSKGSDNKNEEEEGKN